jgi:catechol 2,3-dioxygenase-like lactoylglutathione lyase family enzyme
MSFVALATDSFDEVVRFYGEGLGLPSVEGWDRPGGRGRRFDLGGLRLEVLDNAREAQPLRLSEPADRFHLVIEVEDIEAARSRLTVEAPPPRDTS